MRRLALLFVAVGRLISQPASDPGPVARKALDLLLAEKYSDFTQMLAPQAARAFTLATVEKVGAQIKTFGAVENIGQPTVRQVQTNNVVVIPVKFATANINFQLGVSGAGQVTSLPVFAPGQAEWQRPAYSKSEAFREREATVGEREWKLPGTLTVPVGAGRFPGVVLVHGFGPNDRDHTVGGTKMFKDLAEGLASRGIAVLRYEKRTRQYRPAMMGKPYTVEDDTVEDAVAAAALLRGLPEVNPQRIYVIGYDLGGYITPRIAADDGKLAGLILLAAHTRRLEDVIAGQVEALGATGNQLEAIRAQAKRVKTLDEGDASAPPILGLPVSYFLDLKGYEPVAEAKKLGIPILILQGERDFQVTMADFTLWKSGLSGAKGVTLKSYPALNHLLVAGQGPSTEAEYRRPGHVAPEVIEDMAEFVGQ